MRAGSASAGAARPPAVLEHAGREGQPHTLDRLSRFTDEIRPDFSEVGGDSAREYPESIANQSHWGELDHVLLEQDGRRRDPPERRVAGRARRLLVHRADDGDRPAEPGLIEQAIRPNANGSFTVTLYQDGEPVQYVVTPDMVIGPDRLVGVRRRPAPTATQTELWPLVLEKAMAMHAGSYADIEGDWPDRALGA